MVLLMAIHGICLHLEANPKGRQPLLLSLNYPPLITRYTYNVGRNHHFHPYALIDYPILTHTYKNSSVFAPSMYPLVGCLATRTKNPGLIIRTSLTNIWIAMQHLTLSVMIGHQRLTSWPTHHIPTHWCPPLKNGFHMQQNRIHINC